MFKIMGNEVKDYVKEYVKRMEKVCKEVNANYIYSYDEKLLMKGLYEIIIDCEHSNYNKFMLDFMNLIYMAHLDKDGVIRSGMESTFLDDFYEDLEKGFMKRLSNAEETDEYIEKTVYDYIGSVKLGINSLQFNWMERIGEEVYCLKEDGECRYFAYDLAGHFYDEFIKESKEYLAECIKGTLKESLRIYRNKEQIYDYYMNGRGREMIVRSSLYNIDNPFDRYKDMFEKLENNDFSEFRKNEIKLKYNKYVEREKEAERSA